VAIIAVIMHYFLAASAHTGEHGVDEYPDISGITTARVSDISSKLDIKYY
jgi:catenin alpha